MPTRTQLLTSPGFADANDVTYKGSSISCYLKTPGAVSVLDLEGHILSDGTQYGVGTTSDLVTGAFSLSAVYVGDLRFADGSAAACQLAVAGGNQLIESPVAGYTYAASIDISTWLPTPSATGKTLMILDADLVSDAPYLGLVLPIDISVTAIKADSSVLFAGQPISYAASAGRISALLDPTSTLTPSTARYKITPPGATWYFSVPVNPTGYQGAYNNATAYHVNAGTFASPSDVVLSGGILYQCVADTTGHVPPNVTYWRVFPGEPIVWNLTAVAITGAVAASTANLAHDANLPAITHDPVASPLTLSDDLHNLAWRTNPTALTYTPALQGATDNPVATYTHQIGRYFLLGKRCFISIVVTTSTMTKTTTADPLRVSLPVAAANVAGNVDLLTARAENGTAVAVGSQAYTTPNTSYLQIKQINPAAASADITYAATTPGIGVLINVITVLITGSYETV